MSVDIRKFLNYIDFLRLHQEAKKDGLIVRNRKMLQDDIWNDPRSGYTATIHRLFKDCIEIIFPPEKYRLIKITNRLVYKVKTKEDPTKEGAMFIRAADMHTLTGSVYGSNVMSRFQTAIAGTNIKGPESHNTIMSIEADYRVEDADFTERVPRTYATYKKLKEIKPIYEEAVRVCRDNPPKMKLGELLVRVNRSIPIIEARAVVQPIAITPESIATKADELFRDIEPSMRPTRELQLRLAEKFLRGGR